MELTKLPFEILFDEIVMKLNLFDYFSLTQTNWFLMRMLYGNIRNRSNYLSNRYICALRELTQYNFDKEYERLQKMSDYCDKEVERINKNPTFSEYVIGGESKINNFIEDKKYIKVMCKFNRATIEEITKNNGYIMKQTFKYIDKGLQPVKDMICKKIGFNPIDLGFKDLFTSDEKKLYKITFKYPKRNSHVVCDYYAERGSEYNFFAEYNLLTQIWRGDDDTSLRHNRTFEIICELLVLEYFYYKYSKMDYSALDIICKLNRRIEPSFIGKPWKYTDLNKIDYDELHKYELPQRHDVNIIVSIKNRLTKTLTSCDNIFIWIGLYFLFGIRSAISIIKNKFTWNSLVAFQELIVVYQCIGALLNKRTKNKGDYKYLMILLLFCHVSFYYLSENDTPNGHYYISLVLGSVFGPQTFFSTLESVPLSILAPIR